MTIKTQRLVARATKISKNGKIKEAQKLYPMILEVYPLKQKTKKRSKALQDS